jgi:hypothetical protein
VCGVMAAAFVIFGTALALATRTIAWR